MKTIKTQHIEVDEQSDQNLRFNYTNVSTGLPVNLTGYRAEMQVRCGYEGTSWNSAQLVLTYTSETGGGIVLGGAQGTVDLYISYEDTKEKTWRTASYNLYLITPASARISFMKGFFTINGTGVKLLDSGLPNIASGSPAHPNNLGKGGLDSSNG